MTRRAPSDDLAMMAGGQTARMRTRVALALGLALAAAGPALAQGADEARFHEAAARESALGDMDGALQGYRELLARLPADAALAGRVRLRLARCHEKRGAFVEARTAYEAAAAAGDPALRATAHAALQAMDRRQAEAAGVVAVPMERETLARELAETRDLLRRQARETTDLADALRARERETAQYQARVAELEQRLRTLDAPAAADPATALLRAMEAQAALAVVEVPRLLREASDALRAGRWEAARDAARRAQWLCRDLGKVGAGRPEWEADATALLAATAMHQTEHERAAGTPLPRPVRVRVGLLALPRGGAAAALAAAGAVLRPMPADAEPGCSPGATGTLPGTAVRVLRASGGAREAGAVREVTAPDGRGATLYGTADGPACLVRVEAGEAPGEFVVDAWTWRPAPAGALVAAAPGSGRRVVTRVRARVRAPRADLAVVLAGLADPFQDGDAELLVVLEAPHEAEERR